MKKYDGTFESLIDKKQLTSEQIKQINIALIDNNENFSISGLTMLCMMYVKGAENGNREEDFITFVNENTRENGFCIIEVSKEDTKAKEIMSSWTVRDYDKAVRIYNFLKRKLMMIYIDFFNNPEGHIISEELLQNLTFYKINDFLDDNGIFYAYNVITGCSYPKIKDEELMTFDEMHVRRGFRDITSILSEVSSFCLGNYAIGINGELLSNNFFCEYNGNK